MSRKIIYLLLILAIAAGLRLHAAVTTHEAPRDDALEYDILAQNLSSGRGYVGALGAPTSFRPPLYPFLLAALYSVFGHSYPAVRLFQACLDTLTVFLLYLIGRRIHSEKAGLLAGLFAAVYPSYVILTKFLFTETLFTFLLTLSVFLFLKVRGLKSKTAPIFLGLTLGFLALARSTAMLLPAAYILVLLTSISRDKHRRALYFSGLLLLAYSVTLAPWSLRNTVLHGRPVLISLNGGLNFYQAASPKGGKIFGLVPSDENMQKAKAIANEAERDSFLFSKAVEKTFRNPLLGVKLAVMRAGFYWGFFDWEVQTGREYNYLYGFALPFFLAGLAACSKDVKRFGILLSVIAYFFLIILVSQGTVRYRLPADGCLFIIASCVIVDIVEKAKNKAARLSCIAGWFFANYWLFVNSGLAREFLKGLMRRIGIW